MAELKKLKNKVATGLCYFTWFQVFSFIYPHSIFAPNTPIRVYDLQNLDNLARPAKEILTASKPPQNQLTKADKNIS